MRTVDEVLAAYPGKVRLVFRDYPLAFHEHARKAHEAALCAHEQGRFWEMHDALFADSARLALPDLKARARTLGLDAARFDACLDEGRQGARVAANLAAGEAAGVRGTPHFFVNGVSLEGAQPLERFREVVERELRAAAR